MPDIVFGTQAFTGFQIRDESAWGTGTGTWIDMPIISETLHTVYDQAPPSPEFGGVGAQISAGVLNSRVEGEIRFNARLDAPWFHYWLGHIFGEEDIVLETGLDGAAAVGGNTHWYRPNNTFRSLAARAWKSGPTNAGSWSEFSGLVVGQCRITWDAEGLLTFIVSVTGRLETLAAVSGTLGVPAGALTTKVRWLTNAGANFQTGATLANRDILNFNILINRNVTAARAFLNAIDTPNQPGPTSNRIVTCDIGRHLQQDFAASGMPINEYLARIGSKARIRIRDTALAGTATVYGMDIDFPSILWNAGDNSLKQPDAIPEGLTFQAIQGATAAPAQGDFDVRLGVYVDDAVDLDDHFTIDAGGVVQS